VPSGIFKFVKEGKSHKVNAINSENIATFSSNFTGIVLVSCLLIKHVSALSGKKRHKDIYETINIKSEKGSPTKTQSKKLIPMPFDSRNPTAIALGGVPTGVAMPPNEAANEAPIKSLFVRFSSLNSFDMPKIIGSIRATVAVFAKNMLIAQVVKRTEKIKIGVLLVGSLNKEFAIRCVNPLKEAAFEIKNTPIKRNIMSFPKDEAAFSGVRIPKRAARTGTSNAVTGRGSASVIHREIIKTHKAKLLEV
jgi:hypothetical protein